VVWLIEKFEDIRKLSRSAESSLHLVSIGIDGVRTSSLME
jgi:hypothetical protein